MIGALVFVIVFLILTVVSIVVPGLPPAEMIVGLFSLPESEYTVYINAIVNGVIYGVIVWAAFSVVNMAVKRKKEEKAKFANCPKCKNIVVARKTWIMMGRPDRMGKRMRMEVGLFDCPHCNITFRRILSKKKV